MIKDMLKLSAENAQ